MTTKWMLVNAMSSVLKFTLYFFTLPCWLIYKLNESFVNNLSHFSCKNKIYLMVTAFQMGTFAYSPFNYLNKFEVCWLLTDRDSLSKISISVKSRWRYLWTLPFRERYINKDTHYSCTDIQLKLSRVKNTVKLNVNLHQETPVFSPFNL